MSTPAATPDAVRASLWPHQVHACEMLAGFLRARRGGVGASALVGMPTGTGKSGVIAVAAQYLLSRGDALLLTPWDALVKQLREDVAERFWNRIDVAAPGEKAVLRLYPSTAAESLSQAQRSTIWVATIATLQSLHAEGGAAYDELRRRLRFVVVDEGHYEPARSWSRAVRDLGRPTALFTATPYRNDAKYFDLDEEFQYHFSHAAAERERLVRKVSFQTLAFDDPADFCAKLVKTVDTVLGPDPRRRVIVRCSTFAEVNQIVSELRNAAQSVLGVHERYSGKGDDTHLTRVPPLETRPERYWVHQYKLTEGLDSPEFMAVAFFQPFPSERAFVQQIGRVLRNPRRSSTESALVIHHLTDDLDQSWEAYRAYDRGAETRLPLSPLEAAAAQPPPQYFGGRFRSSFDIRGDVSLTDLRFPRSVRVLEVGAAFDLDELAEKVADYLDEKDCLHERVLAPREDIRLHPYMRITNSPILFRAAFYQSTLGYTFYRRIDDYLLYLDTEGLYPDALDRFTPADPGALRRLYSGRNVRLGSISLSNTNIGALSARRRTLHARSLADLAPDLSDHAQIATTVTGSYEVPVSVDEVRYVSRYVGFSRARVSDRGLVSFEEFDAWLSGLAAALRDSTAVVPPVFRRYADVVPKPASTAPRNILLDFDPSEFRDLEGAEGDFLHIDDLCCDVEEGKFTLGASETNYEVGIRWDDDDARYVLTCPALDQRFGSQASRGSPGHTLIAFLNRDQAFRIVPVTETNDYTIYANRRFYRPRLPLGPTADETSLDLLRLFEGVDRLGEIAEEKGPPGSVSDGRWAPNTLFGFVDSCGAGTILERDMDFEVLVCDDLGTEIADFLGLDTRGRRIVAVHAKAFPAAKTISASSLQEVTAQAIKNLGYLQPYPYGQPANLGRWSGPWTGRAGVVSSRLRRGNGTPDELWARFRSAIVDPRVTREVWILLGQGPSESLLRAESAAISPKAEAVQMLFSLQATWSAVSSIGARLRILSRP